MQVKETDTPCEVQDKWHKSWISRSFVTRASHNSEKSAELRDAAYVIRVRPHLATRLKRKFPSSGNSLAVSNPLQIRKDFRRSRNVINTDSRPCSPSLYLKATQNSVLPPKSEERVHEENDSFDNTEGAFGQAGVAERRLVYQFLEVVDVERARGDEQGASNQREEEILKDKKLHLA